MGKTAAALAILHNQTMRDTFGSCCFFVPCEAAITVDLLVKSVLQVLSVQSSGKEDALTALHRCLMQSAPMLLVLDNFETPWEAPGAQSEVQDVLCRIASVKHVSLIVTMRGNTSPSGIKWNPGEWSSALPPLDPEAARSAFLTVNPEAGATESDGCLKTLLHEMDHVPLAIMLMAQAAKGDSDCKHLLHRWRNERTSMLQTQGPHSGRLSSVDVSISLSLKSPAVAENPDTIQLLAVICHMPDGIIKWKETC
jgi:hypothetical protein